METNAPHYTSYTEAPNNDPVLKAVEDLLGVCRTLTDALYELEQYVNIQGRQINALVEAIGTLEHVVDPGRSEIKHYGPTPQEPYPREETDE